jgi:hypothetical protein
VEAAAKLRGRNASLEDGVRLVAPTGATMNEAVYVYGYTLAINGAQRQRGRNGIFLCGYRGHGII